jgi:putative transposase
LRVAGGTYFFTVNLLDRRSGLLVDHVGLLRSAVRLVKNRRPFTIDAWVVLPDHMHCMWTLPDGDSDFSNRWKDIKAQFSRSLPNSEPRDRIRRKNGERGISQRRFWEHAIRSEADYDAHLNYIHLNPYKHGLVARVKEWPYSSFHRFVRAGIYPEDWMTEPVDLDCGE